MSRLSPMQEGADEFVKGVTLLFNECRGHCYMTRAREIQDERRSRLHERLEECLRLKEASITASDENLADALLSVEYVLRAVFQELSMWIALKEGRSKEAWDCLVVAQADIRCAMKAHRIGANVQSYAAILDRIEHVVFPPQLFLSIGIRVGRYECSICGREYGTCGHIVGRAYMGELCSRLPRELGELDHCAFVENPADKRCRTETTEVDGEDRDTLTWETVPRDGASEATKPGYFRMRGCMLRADIEPGT